MASSDCESIGSVDVEEDISNSCIDARKAYILALKKEIDAEGWHSTKYISGSGLHAVALFTEAYISYLANNLESGEEDDGTGNENGNRAIEIWENYEWEDRGGEEVYASEELHEKKRKKGGGES